MIISIADLKLCYEKIKKNASPGLTTVVIFVSHDTDSLYLSEKWFNKNEKVRVYIFDHHKPVHHNNIILVDDGFSNFEECPAPEDLEAFQMEEDEDEEIDEFNNEQDEDNEENENENYYNAGKDEEEEIQIGKKRKKILLEEKKFEKKLKIARKKKIDNYYKGSFFGKPTASILYNLSQQLNQESNDFLWYAILGLTDLLIHNKISQKQYQKVAYELSQEVLRLNINDSDEKKDIILKDYEHLNFETNNKPKGTIFIENEHWTLYDSMFYSSYLAPRLNIWKETGTKKLNQLIALLGIPLDQAKQQYRFMDPVLKTKLKEEIGKIAQTFELDDILFYSFTRQIDEKNQFTATDMVYCLSAILGSIKYLESIEGLGNELPKEEDRPLNKNFWRAFDTLKAYFLYYLYKRENIEWIKEGIEIAIDFQKAVINETIFLIEKKSIIPATDFRYALLSGDTYIEKKYFHHPLALQKLAILIMEFFKLHKNNTSEKPIMLCVQNFTQNTFLVVGFVGLSKYLDISKNEFGNKFSEVAEKINLKTKQDSFETSVIEINKEDFAIFLEELTF